MKKTNKSMKIIMRLTRVLAAIMIYCLTVNIPNARAASAESDFVCDASGTITSYSGTSAIVEIPTTIGGVTVTAIGNSAFYSKTSITQVTMPDSITTIGSDAFSNCTNLTKVKLPKNLTVISDQMFVDCTKLKEINFPESVTSIGSYAFGYCDALVEVVLPQGITEIGYCAFYGCDSLKNVRLPASVNKVHQSFADNCVILEALYIEGNAPSIYEDSDFNNEVHFFYLDNATKIYYKAENTSVAEQLLNSSSRKVPLYHISISSAIGGSISIESVTGATIDNEWIAEGGAVNLRATPGANMQLKGGSLKYNDGIDRPINAASFLMPSTAVTISAEFMLAATTSYSVTVDALTDGVVTANLPTAAPGEIINLTIVPSAGKQLVNGSLKYALNGTEYAISGTSFIMPEGDVVVHAAFEDTDYTFDAATGTITGYSGNQSMIEIPSSINGMKVNAIGSKAFYQKSSLTAITIPEGVTRIANHAFTYCSSLENVVLPDSLISIGDGVFYYCSSLRVIKIPANVESIGDIAFKGDYYNQNALQKVYFLGKAPALGSDVFEYNKENLTVYYPNANSADFTGGQWESLTKVAIDYSGVYSITYDANNAGEGSVPAQVTGLKVADYVTLPDAGTLKREGYLFDGWNTAADGSGTNWDAGEQIMITNASITLYANWVKVYKISINASEHGNLSTDVVEAGVGTNIIVTVTMDEGYHVVEGSHIYRYTLDGNIKTGKLQPYKSDTIYIFQMPASDVTISVEFIDSDYSIKDGYITAYYGKGGNLIIPSNINGVIVKGISNFAFCENGSLTSVVVPNTVITIGRAAFAECINLQGVTLSEGVKVIGEDAFSECLNLQVVTLPNTLTTIEDGGFYGCWSLRSIRIPENTSKIGTQAFENCRMMETAIFNGNAPVTLGGDVFGVSGSAIKVRYKNGKTGFDNSFGGYSFEEIQMSNSGAAVQADLETLKIIYNITKRTNTLVKISALSGPSLTINSETKDTVKSNIYLPTIGAVSGSSITWVSNNPNVISNQGEVVRPNYESGDATVQLIATVTFGNSSNTKNFELTVLKEEQSQSISSVTFVDGSSIYATKTVIQGSTLDSDFPANPTKSSYTFKGWYSGRNGTGTRFTSSVAITSNITVYALWKRNNSGNNNGGSVIQNPTPTQFVETMNESGNQIARTISSTTKEGTLNATIDISSEDLTKLLDKKTDNSEPLDLQLPIVSQHILDQIEDPEVEEVDITVNLPERILSNDNRGNLNLVLNAEMMKAAAKEKKDIQVSVKDETGRERYSWSFSGEDLSNSREEIEDINLSLSVERVADREDMQSLLANQNSDSTNIENGLIIDFEHDGNLPAQAAIRVYVGNLFNPSEPNRRIYLYHYNPTTGKLDTLPCSSEYKVDDGYITINILHCSDYVILPKKADRESISSLRERISITPLKSELYIGGTKNMEVNLALSLPQTLELVASLVDKTSSSAVGGVVVTYKSMDNTIAEVDNDGKITAKGVGTTDIITTIQLYSNKTKTIKTSITVKNAYIQIIAPKNINSMKVGESDTYTAKAYGLELSQAVWSTTKKSIIVINKNSGVAIAKSKGTDYIKVRIGNVTKTLKVVVS